MPGEGSWRGSGQALSVCCEGASEPCCDRHSRGTPSRPERVETRQPQAGGIEKQGQVCRDGGVVIAIPDRLPDAAGLLSAGLALQHPKFKMGQQIGEILSGWAPGQGVEINEAGREALRQQDLFVVEVTVQHTSPGRHPREPLDHRARQAGELAAAGREPPGHVVYPTAQYPLFIRRFMDGHPGRRRSCMQQAQGGPELVALSQIAPAPLQQIEQAVALHMRDGHLACCRILGQKHGGAQLLAAQLLDPGQPLDGPAERFGGTEEFEEPRLLRQLLMNHSPLSWPVGQQLHRIRLQDVVQGDHLGVASPGLQQDAIAMVRADHTELLRGDCRQARELSFQISRIGIPLPGHELAAGVHVFQQQMAGRLGPAAVERQERGHGWQPPGVQGCQGINPPSRNNGVVTRVHH